MLWLDTETHQQMQHEREAHWFCEYGIIVKLTTQSIGYLMHGAMCDVLIFEDRSHSDRHLISSFRIFDCPKSPMILFGIINTEDQIVGLRNIISRSLTKMFVFNELNIQVAEIDIEIDWSGFDLDILDISGLFLGMLSVEQNLLLDKLNEGSIRNYKKAYRVDVLSKQIIRSTIYNSKTPAEISFHDECGVLQEFVSYTLLTAVFKEDCHWSLKERVGNLEK